MALPLTSSVFAMCLCAVLSPVLGQGSNGTLSREALSSIRSSFRLQQPGQGLFSLGCDLLPGDPNTLDQCGFQRDAPRSFLIIHGWTVIGMLEAWVEDMVAALQMREPTSNVIVVDWLFLAHQHYPVAAENTQGVGQDIATFLLWLQEETGYPLQRVHLIGYSLGAHAAGFAGSHMTKTNQIGRITGLDPAGPRFEGKDSHRRLSQEDAKFVDVLHTFTRGSVGLSIGIKQPVGHMDIYPNGGTTQPGCDIRNIFGGVSSHGLVAFAQAFKCEHERSVHLFIDSLLHSAGRAYRCKDAERFDRGLCLNCRKMRCNMLGYGAHAMRTRRSSTMYLRTRGDMPYRVHHYQLKVAVSNSQAMQQEHTRPTFTLSLFGTKGNAEELPVAMNADVKPNRTQSFLVTTEMDVGEITHVGLHWPVPEAWYSSVWTTVKRLSLSWWNESTTNPMIYIRRLILKSGETQQKMKFCSQDGRDVELAPTGEEIVLVKCQSS
uniref:lipoprotein lipase-like n=1 Tax=Myxine glutinosa TaxID=7769 RepID=UPI00358F34D6